MEDSPLMIGHNHATQATKLLQGSPHHTPEILLSASSSHSLAATSFASAARITRDSESHRTLEILVQQHTRWAAQLKALAENPANSDTTPTPSAPNSPDRKSRKSSRSSSPVQTRSRPNSPPAHVPFVKTTGTTYPPRLQKSTSSLATNLASARGIPSTDPSARRRRPGTLADPKPTTSPLNLLPPDTPSSSPPRTPQEEPFSKFYSSLNTLINRIGSPFTASLAFTSLPVTPTSSSDPPPNVLPHGWTHGRGRGRNLFDESTGGGESFYVVPTSGGTMSYAGIVRGEDHTDSTLPGKPRPLVGGAQQTTTQRRDGMTRFAGHNKTMEELQLENVTLRRTVEQMTRERVRAERRKRGEVEMLRSGLMAAGGRQGLEKLMEMSWVRGEDGEEEVYSEGRHVGELEMIKEEAGGNGVEEKLRELERTLEEERRKREKMERENGKLQEKVRYYGEKWEGLRESARKRAAKGEGSVSREGKGEKTIQEG